MLVCVCVHITCSEHMHVSAHTVYTVGHLLAETQWQFHTNIKGS